MGIEDPGWGRIIIVIFFIAVLLGFLYFSKNIKFAEYKIQDNLLNAYIFWFRTSLLCF